MSSSVQSVKGIVWGVISSFFLSSTFLINSLIAESGGHWTWTANLRTLFLIPILALVLFLAKQLHPFLQIIKLEPWLFIKWGLIGFGVLYTFLAIASLLVPGWLVAATFQINILAGVLLAPFIYNDHRKKIPRQSVVLSTVILVGVLTMQFEKLGDVGSIKNVIISFVLVLIGAIVWPLGNRKLMIELEQRGIRLNASQRVLGMSIGSIPLMLALAVVGYYQSGWPPLGQCKASFYSAVFSGFLGGVAFYYATHMVHKNPVAIAAIEATQSLEIIFTLLGEMVLIGISFPGLYGKVGMFIVLSGLFFHFWNSLQYSKKLENTITCAS